MMRAHARQLREKAAQPPNEEDADVPAPLTGEAGALVAGRLPGRMGDRAHVGLAPRRPQRSPKIVANDGKQKSGAGADGGRHASLAHRKAHSGATHPGRNQPRDVLDASVADMLDHEVALAETYVPRTEAAQQAYEHLLAFVQKKLGDYPIDVLSSAACEVIAALRAHSGKAFPRGDTNDGQALREGSQTIGKDKVSAILGALSDADVTMLGMFAGAMDDFEEQRDGRNQDEEPEELEMTLNLDGAEDAEGERDDESLSGAEQDVSEEDVVEAGESEFVHEKGVSDDDASINSAMTYSDHSSPSGSVIRGPPDLDDGVPPEVSGAGPECGNLLDLLTDFFPVVSTRQAISARLYEELRCAEDVFEDDQGSRKLYSQLEAIVGDGKATLVELLIRYRSHFVKEHERNLISNGATAQEPASADGFAAVMCENGNMEFQEKGKRKCKRLRDPLAGENSEKSGSGDEVGSHHSVRQNADASISLLGEEKTKKKRRKKDLDAMARKNFPGQSHADRGLNIVDIDGLFFDRGSHFVSSTSVELPKGTFRVKKKDCEEVHVPAIPSRKMGGAPKLVSVEDMPPLAREAFTGTTHLNRVQSEVYPCAFESDENMLVCAPTGAGKTNVAMMCILRLVAREPLENLRVVYIAPMKALVSEVVGNLSRRLAYLGISVAELTGDASLSRRQMDSTHVVVSTPEKWDILTRKTAQGVRSLAYNVRLMIIDEIHLLHDERGPVLESIVARVRRCVTQGSMNTRVVGLSATLPNVEDVGAFLGCSQESSSHQKSVFHFDASFRPCPLQSVYVGVQKGSGWKRLQSMNEIAYEHVRAQLEASASAQVIVFVHSRKETATTAKYFRESAREQGVLDRLFMVPNSASQNIVRSELGTVRNAVLRDVMGSSGIGIHHAGLAAADRALTEDLFADGHLRVLVSTATLAWGVNLPAHAIVIKGTQVYSPEKGAWVELSPIDVMQMMGRAGRPQFDSFGEGIIITSASQMQFYLSLLNQQLPIESQLMTRFTDSLNAEIAMRNVSSIADGAEWLGYTYYGTRMMRSPSLYGVSCIAHSEQDAITIQSRRRMDLIHSACIKLERAGLVRYDKKKLVVGPTELGRIASEYYISSASMAAYVQHLKADISVMDLLRVFSMSAEFRSVRVRQEEKMELKRLAERVPYPLVDGGNAMLADSGSAILAGQTVDGSNDKVIVLLQAYISRLTLDGLVLAADMVYVTQSAARIARALFDLVLRRRWAQAAEKCLSLYKMIKWRQWNVESPLRQFGSAGAVGPDHHRIVVPTELLRKLERKDMELERFFDLDEKQLGDFLRNAKLGTLTFRLLHHLPYLDVAARVRPVTPHLLDVELNLVPDFVFDGARFHAAGQAFWVWVEDADADMILFAKQVFIRAALAHEEHALKFTVALQQQSQQQQPVPSVDPYYFVHVMSDSWISRDVVVPLSLRSLELPQVFELRTKVHADPSATRGEQSTLRATIELAAIKSQIEGELESSGQDVVPSDGIYQWRKNVMEAVLMHVQTNLAISRLNVIQSRVFDSIFCTDANCFVSMPGGSGRGVLIDLCIARAFWSKPRAVCVVLAAYGDTAAVRRREQLASGIARLLGIAANVHVLTGDLSSDFKLLESGDSGAILVVTPTAWDMLSRRWKQRKSIVRIDLFIADHVELVGSFDLDGSASGSGLSQRRLGVTLEVVLSRMRYIRNSHKKAAFRMVAFADIMSNARDIIDWLGVEKEHGYCFPMDARVIPLDTHVQSLDLDPNSESGTGGGAGMRRQFAMAVCRILTQLTKDHSTPLLVVVNSRGNAISIAAELLVSLPAHSVTSEMNTVLSETAGFSEIKSASLRECIEHGGVAFLHEGVSQADRVALLQLYVKGALRVMVLTPAMLQHDGRLRANVVVLAGTTREESRMGCNIAQQYAFSEVYLMLGRAGVSVPTPEPAVDHEWPRSGSSRRAAVAYVLTEPAYKEYYVRCLGEALPVESGLDQGPDLADHMNAEIVSRVIETQQDMIDYLTWTLYYRRLMQNPNYYGLNLVSTLSKQGNKNAVAATRQRISEHLSQLVEDCVTELRETKCISVEGQFGASTVVDNGSDLIASPGEAAPGTIGDGIVILGALNLGMIASHYYVQHATITVFSQSLSEKTTRLRSLMEILAAASEFDDLPVRSDEEAALRTLATHTDVLAAGRHDLLDRVADPHVKALVLMHSHLRRALGTNTPPQLREDQTRVVRTMVRLLYALVDVASSSGWLKTTLAAMELCQAVVQACWPARIANQQSQPRLSPLQQLPHMDASLLARLASCNVHGVFDLLDMEEEERTAAFKGLSRAQIADIARFCNAFPNVDFSCAVHPARLALPAGHDVADDSGVVTVRVRLERDPDDDDDDHSDHEEEAGPAAAERGEARGQEAQELDGIERESLPRLQMPRPLPTEAVSKTTPSPGESSARAAHAPLYPGRKDEGWWVCVGDVRQNRILALKRAVIDERQPVELELRFREDDWFSEETANQANVRTSAHHEDTVAQAPRQLGVFLISDCYLGCDQEETLLYCTSPSS